MKKLGYIVFLIAFIVSIIETSYYGWNWHPHSVAEWAWDCGCFSVMLVGVILVKTNKKEKV